MGAFAVGQAIPAELVIKHTRGWSNQTGAESKDEQLEFYYEVHTHPDTWLVGGQRKAHFSARVSLNCPTLRLEASSQEMIKENESLSFPLLLLPQRVGLLLYPSVDVSLLHRRDKASIEDQGASSKTIPVCETDYRSQCDTLLVIANLRSTTVSLDPGSSGSGSWLVESIPGRCT